MGAATVSAMPSLPTHDASAGPRSQHTNNSAADFLDELELYLNKSNGNGVPSSTEGATEAKVPPAAAAAAAATTSSDHDHGFSSGCGFDEGSSYTPALPPAATRFQRGHVAACSSAVPKSVAPFVCAGTPPAGTTAVERKHPASEREALAAAVRASIVSYNVEQEGRMQRAALVIGLSRFQRGSIPKPAPGNFPATPGVQGVQLPPVAAPVVAPVAVPIAAGLTTYDQVKQQVQAPAVGQGSRLPFWMSGGRLPHHVPSDSVPASACSATPSPLQVSSPQHQAGQVSHMLVCPSLTPPSHTTTLCRRCRPLQHATAAGYGTGCLVLALLVQARRHPTCHHAMARHLLPSLKPQQC